MPRLTLVCGPEVLLCRFPPIRARRLPLCSVSLSAPGRPSCASQQCCPSSCPPAVLFHSCLASAPVALLKKAFPQSLHHPPCLWPSEGSQLLHRPVSPLQGHQLPRAGAWQPCSLPCLLSVAGVAMYVFDYWNLIWIWSNSHVVIKIHQIQLFKVYHSYYNWICLTQSNIWVLELPGLWKPGAGPQARALRSQSWVSFLTLTSTLQVT